MEFKGTKAPWVIKGNPSNLGEHGFSATITADKPKGLHDYFTDVFGETEEECMANANLVIAAPDMLKELLQCKEDLVEMIGVDMLDAKQWQPRLDSINAAINKALGTC